MTAVSAASGIARSTINRGIAELKAGRVDELGARIRRRGGGRKRAVEGQPGLLAALEGLIEGAIRGDPQSPLRWVSLSQRNIAAVLGQQGFEVSQKLVGVLLRQLDYSCQANRKTREGTQHPDRNAQFEYINAKVKAALAASQPAISVDTKKGAGGRLQEWRSRAAPQGRARAGACPRLRNQGIGEGCALWGLRHRRQPGLVNVGIDADTAAFAVESIRRWWQRLGKARYPDAARLLITADCGGSNGARVHLWKRELQNFANQTGLVVTVVHLPPGTSKWNRIEHRLFAYITQNWRGKPLVSHKVIVQLIAATSTTKDSPLPAASIARAIHAVSKSLKPNWLQSKSSITLSTASGTTPSNQTKNQIDAIITRQTLSTEILNGEREFPSRIRWTSQTNRRTTAVGPSKSAPAGRGIRPLG